MCLEVDCMCYDDHESCSKDINQLKAELAHLKSLHTEVSGRNVTLTTENIDLKSQIKIKDQKLANREQLVFQLQKKADAYRSVAISEVCEHWNCYAKACDHERWLRKIVSSINDYVDEEALAEVGRGVIMNDIEKTILLKLKAYISSNFLDLSDTCDHEDDSGCETCGGNLVKIEGTDGMTMNKISDVIDEFIEMDGFKGN